jgi:hypothetical protein
MAGTERELRRELDGEREKLAAAVETLRSEIGEAKALGGKLRARLPVAAAGMLGLSVLAKGGIRALRRRARSGEPAAKTRARSRLSLRARSR